MELKKLNENELSLIEDEINEKRIDYISLYNNRVIIQYLDGSEFEIKTNTEQVSCIEFVKQISLSGKWI